MKRWIVVAAAGLAAARGQAAYPPPVPPSLWLGVAETAGVARSGEVVRSGIPLPRSLEVLDTADLAVVDAAGAPVPAEFRVLARWNAGLSDASAPIQWLLVTFPASVAAGGTAGYRLVLDGSAGPNPSPPTPLTLVRSGNQVTVDTGAATFVLGGDPGALFDEVRRADGTPLVLDGAMTARVAGIDQGHPVTRSVRVEQAGPLAAVVVVEGEYAMAPVGGGRLGSLRRYVFTAGSPTAVVRHVVQWEGDRCGAGVLACGGAPNGVRLERLRDALTLGLAHPLQVQAVGSFGAAAVAGAAAAGQEARVRQRLRASRSAPLAFEVAVPGTPGAAGTEADGGLLAVGGAAGAVAVALDHLHRYEPQALRLLPDGRLAIDLADDQAWLGARQGLFATLAVGAFPSLPSRADLDRQVWAPLNQPLRGWPSAQWWAASGAVDEFPSGPLPPGLARYDELVQGVIDATLAGIGAKGLQGLMTFGVYPRDWGRWYDELDCGPDEPTPAEAWDDAYWCGTWTDYHNAAATVPMRVMRSGQVRLLDELAVPAALRVLYTQVQRCAPGDAWFYCGQAPAGYGGYRADFNSSHAYFENLFLHYWLTGDSTVLDTLSRGAESMRRYLCSRRPASACLPADPPADEWAHLTGRVAMQWAEVFRFLGLAGPDASFLEDWRANLARAATQHYVQPSQGGTAYGFWLSGGDRVDGPGTDGTDQLWMASLYDMNALHRLGRDTLDAPVGSPALPPGAVLAAWARTLADHAADAAPGGDGSAAGDWPNGLFFTWSGGRVGGTLSGVAPDLGGGDPLLYDTGKACLTAAVVRAADGTGDAGLLAMGADLTQHTLDAALAELQPLNKVQGLYLSRLHAAVARLAAREPAALPADFYTLAPCRVLDTRGGAALASQVARFVPVAGACGVPATARAVAVNLTVVGPTGAGHLTAWPGDAPMPGTSTLSFAAGQTRTNNAVLALGSDGSGRLAVRAQIAGAGEVHLAVDVSGYFE